MNEAQPAGQLPEAEATPFNMAMLFYINLNKIIELKDAAYMANDIEGWYKGLNRIFNKICFKLNDNERQDIEKLFNDIRPMINKDMPGACSKLQDIDFKLVAFMDRYNMIFPRIDNSSGIDRLKKRYQL